jgi:anti-sigma B factor antagonist
VTPDLALTLGHGPTGPVLAVAGDLDHASVGRLREAVDALVFQPGQLLTLDLSLLACCDSSGITALLAARNRVRAQAADIALSNVPPATIRVLSLLGLDAIFRIKPSPEAV